MNIKKTACLVLAAVVVCTSSITAFAAPYQNYTITESGVFQEPQAYVPDQLINSEVIGIENLQGVAISKPQDLIQFDLKEYILISDTDNNRIVILDKDLKTVKQIISSWNNNGKEDTFSSPNGLFVYNAENLLYVCDTNNKRIVRFAYNNTTDSFVFDRTFNDPDISKYFSSDSSGAQGTATPTATPQPTATPEVTATPEANATPEAEATATPEADAAATPLPDDETEINTDNTSSGSGSAITYTPLKVVVDNSMRMFVVSKDCYQGLVELSKDGEFNKFFGATKTKQTLSALLSRLFTAQAKSLLQQNLSTEYSNATIDPEGFIYGTISQLKGEDLASHFQSATEVGAALRKLNAAGSDVMLRQGIVPPSGDWGIGQNRTTYSFIVDATVSKNNLTSILDSQKGRVFTYTSTGELLYVFGALGQRRQSDDELNVSTREEQVGYTKGTSLSPVAIELLKDDETIVVLDSEGACFTTYVPTEYGLILRDAVNSHEERRYEDALNAWNKILGMSSNSAIAYKGVGKIMYLQAAEELDGTAQRQKYIEAADYFKKAYCQDEYAKAFYKYRDKVLENIMPYLMTIIIIIAAAAIIIGQTKKFRHFVKTKGRNV